MFTKAVSTLHQVMLVGWLVILLLYMDHLSEEQLACSLKESQSHRMQVSFGRKSSSTRSQVCIWPQRR